MMRKLGLALVASLLVNALLAGWLVAQYLSDVYFRIYIGQFFASNSTYLILTLGVGGGSTVGYLFLRRKGHVDRSSLSGFQKTKPLKANGGLHYPPLAAASQGKVLPAGAPPTQPSKHTAYAVPPISKSFSPSPSSFQKGTPGPAWTSAGKSAITKQPSPPYTPISSPRQSTSSPVSMDRARQPLAPSTFESRPTSSTVSSQTSSPPGPTSFTPPFTRSPSPPSAPIQKADQFPPARQQPDAKSGQDLGFSKWASEPGMLPEKSESVFSPARPVAEGFGGAETGLKRVPIQGAGPTFAPPSSQSQAQPQIPSSKWQGPDSMNRPNPQAPTGEWVSPVPKQPYNPGARPGPQGSSVPGQRPQSSSTLPMRPGQAAPPRPLFAPGQSAPRPLAYPGASRPVQVGGGTPGTFRLGLVVTGPQGAVPRGVAPGQGTGQRPQQPSNLSQNSDVKGPPPPSSGRPSQSEVASTVRRPGLTGAAPEAPAGQPSSSSDERPSSELSSGAEMDWDTALDTILKTLRKDKVGEK